MIAKSHQTKHGKLSKLGKNAILRALAKHNTVTDAAKALDVSRQALTRYMSLNGISIKRQVQVTEVIDVEAERLHTS